MQTIVAALTHTPWWVFAIFVVVILRGVAALSTRTVAVWKLALLPTIFAVWGVYSLLDLFGLDVAALTLFSAALAAGAGLGLALAQLGTVRSDPAKNLIEISGSPITLILILIIFAAKYALGYWLAVDAGARSSFGFLAADAVAAGAVIGVFVGRLAGLLRRYRTAPLLTVATA